jgi:hypothetical protein
MEISKRHMPSGFIPQAPAGMRHSLIFRQR